MASGECIEAENNSIGSRGERDPRELRAPGVGRRVIREAERYGEGTQRRLVPEIYRLAVCSSATLLTRVIGNLANIIEISFAWQSVLTWTARKALHAVTEALAEALAQKGTMHDDQTAPDLLHRSGP